MRSRLPAAVLLVMLALAGCGDDTPTIKTKADFIKAADKLCVARDKSSVELQAIQNDADLARLSGQLAEIYDTAITKLKALDLPPGTARPGAQKYVVATAALQRPVQQMEAASKRLAQAVESHETDALKAAGQELQNTVNSVQALNEVADAAAREYGMHDCGQSGTSNPVS